MIRADLASARDRLADYLTDGRIDADTYDRAVKELDAITARPERAPGVCAGCGAQLPKPAARGRPPVACGDCRGVVRRVEDARRHEAGRHADRIRRAMADESGPFAGPVEFLSGRDPRRYGTDLAALLADGFTWERRPKQAPLPRQWSESGPPGAGHTLPDGSALAGAIYLDSGEGELDVDAIIDPHFAQKRAN